jgi:hypothetical protein
MKAINDIAFCITTVEREHCTQNLIKSIRSYYPEAKIYVADQSNGNYDAKVFKMDYDCGLSYSRNFLWRNTDEPYKLLLDDDFIFTGHTKIERFRTLIEYADIVCGSVRERGSIRNYEYDLRIEGDTLYYDPPKAPKQVIEGLTCQQVQLAMNFGLFKANTDNWDDNLKICEHTDYYLRFKGKLLYTPDVIVDHIRDRPAAYGRLRRRNSFYVQFMQKHGLTKIVNGNKVTQIKDGKLI